MGKQGKAITLLVPADLPKWRRMARDLGQTAIVQRLAIDEETISTVQAAKAEAAVTQEQERQPYSEQSPTRYNKQERQPYSEQPPIRRNKQERDSYSEQPTVRRNKQERDSYSEQPTIRYSKQVSVDRELEQEYSRSERPQRDNRFSRSTGKPKTRTFAASEPQYRTARKKFGTAPARRTNNSKRAVSR
jgi:superfamily II DNA/RNA helicase